MRRLELVNVTTEAYQVHPPGVSVVSQIYSEVQMVHELENEGKWVFLGGINANKWYKTLSTVVKAAACQRFLVQSLPATFRERKTVAW